MIAILMKETNLFIKFRSKLKETYIEYSFGRMEQLFDTVSHLVQGNTLIEN